MAEGEIAMRTQPGKTGLTPAMAAGRDEMQAIVQDTYGSADRLRLSRIEKPVIAATRSWCRYARQAWTGARVI